MIIEWNEENGLLSKLSVRGGADWAVSPGKDVFPVSILNGGAAAPPAFDRIETESRGGVEKISVVWNLETLELREEYLLHSDVLSRRIIITNRGGSVAKVDGVRLLLGGFHHGDPRRTFFSSPGNNTRPRVPVAALPGSPGGAPNVYFAPSAEFRWDQPFETAPDMSSGILGLHDPASRESLLIWYWSEVENAVPGVSKAGEAVYLYHDVALAAWLKPGESVTGGTQYLTLRKGSWEEALTAYRDRLPAQGLIPLYGPEPPEWVRNAVIFETHPGLFGGFEGLEKEIPRLAATGFNVLYLMPIWEYDNKKGVPWDGNWTGTGSPYAIRDFEKLDPALGAPEDFRKLVESAHEYGMKVLVDFVSQGCARDSRYVIEHPDWFERDEEGNMFSSHGWNDTFSFDWAHPFFQEYMLGWSLSFLREFDVDGFRVDAPHGKEPNWDKNLYRRHASESNLGVLRLLEWLQVEMKRIKQDAALLCEASGPVFVKSHDFSYDYPASAQFFSFLEGRLSAGELCVWLEEHSLTLPPGATRVCFTETHDTRTNKPPSYAMRGSVAEKAMVASMVMAGFRPMIWSGQEQSDPDFYRRLFELVQREDSLKSGGVVRCGQVDVGDPAGSDSLDVPVLVFVRGELIGISSFLPERRTFRLRFRNLPWIEEDFVYRILEMLSGEFLEEYGKGEWRGAEVLSGMDLTLDPFRPYFLKFVRTDGV